jgi:hypothetical protein
MRPLPAWLLAARPFLQSAPTFSGSYHLGSLAVDFDDTITAHDTTTAVLFETVAEVAAAPMPQAARRALWADLSAWYSAEAAAWGAQDYRDQVPAGLASQSPALRRAALLAHAQRLSAFEAQCVRRVSESAAVAGATRPQLRDGARRQASALVRPGVAEALALARQLGARPHVVKHSSTSRATATRTRNRYLALKYLP